MRWSSVSTSEHSTDRIQGGLGRIVEAERRAWSESDDRVDTPLKDRGVVVGSSKSRPDFDHVVALIRQGLAHRALGTRGVVGHLTRDHSKALTAQVRFGRGDA